MSSRIQRSILTGDEEEAKRWNRRFSAETTEKIDKYINSSIAVTSNTDKVSKLWLKLTANYYNLKFYIDCCNLIGIADSL